MKRISAVTLLWIVLATVVGFAQRGDGAPGQRRVVPPPPDGEAVADFDRRMKAYAELRDKLDDGAAKLNETSKPEKITNAEQVLAAKIRAARVDARRGDIFTPQIAARFRSLLNPEVRGARGQATKNAIKEDSPPEETFPFRVNGAYPTDQPLSTMPPNVLQALPRLPQDIEYRFVAKHLLLRDAKANLIIDFMPNAIS